MKRLCCLLLTIGCTLLLFAVNRISFQHLGSEEGLSQSSVFSITQDNHGFLWIATSDGLNKYDGYHFTVYRHADADFSSIPSSVIRCVMVDRKGTLWIGTDKGLACYQEEQDNFKTFREEQSDITNIVQTDANHFLLTNGRRLQFFQLSTGKMIPTAYQNVTALHKSGDDIYVGSFQGVFIYHVSSHRFRQLMIPELQGKYILAILKQSATKLWVATEGDGLLLVNPQEKTITTYNTTNSELRSNDIRSLAVDAQGRLWVGTKGSLGILQPDGHFMVFESNLQQEGSLSHSSVRSIFQDAQGGMWVGTYFGGLNYWHPLRNRFQLLRPGPFNKSLNDKVIGAMAEDSEHRLWIGTNQGGLNCYDPATGLVRYFTMKEGLRTNDIKAIFRDGSYLYVGGHQGGCISIIRTSDGHINSVPLGDNADDNRVYAIAPSDNDLLWIGSPNGLKLFSKTSQSVSETGIDLKRVRTVWQDERQRLWVGTENGLFIYALKNGHILARRLALKVGKLSDTHIHCIISHGNDVWIGTNDGVYVLSRQLTMKHHFTVHDGLPSQIVQGIICDDLERFWMSTNHGLCAYNVKTREFRNFSAMDGLHGNQFNEYSFCKTTDGRMFFGGTNGVTSFNPDMMADNPYTPSVIITQLQLYGKTVTPHDSTGVLMEHITQAKRMELSSSQRMFTLSFVVPNFIAGQHNTFAYRLEGYEQDWHYVTDVQQATYSNLPPGSYLFQVKAANNDGKWNETPTALEIIVHPAWYQTWWARLCFLLLLGLFCWYLVRHYLKQRLLQMRVLQEQRDKLHMSQLNEMKQRFFIDISHELRTPLTLILSPIEELQEQWTDKWSRGKLELMHKNVLRLLHLVNQLMDSWRAESGFFKLQVRPTLVHDEVERHFALFKGVAQSKGIHYRFTSEVQGLQLLCDQKYLELIVNNLLSNAFKYTDSGQSITVGIKTLDDSWQLSIEDTGTGISQEQQQKIFERFYQVDAAHIGSGVGLSLVNRLVSLHHGQILLDSTIGEGSRFTVIIPNEADKYQSDELVASTETAEQVYSTNTPDMYLLDTEEKLPPPITSDESEPSSEDVATILIVEDHAEISAYLSESLSGKYHVLTAANGQLGLEIVQTETVDLVLSDVMMPVMDGLKMCKAIKQNIQTSHIPVIILSAKADIHEQLEGLKTGADDYIPKPFSLDLVKTKIANILRTRYQLIENHKKSLEIHPEKVATNELDEKLLKECIAVVERHIDDTDFSTEQFAREMLMSRSGLHLKLKALTGESTNDFIRHIRFNKAVKLLEEGAHTMAEISYLTGFNTPSYFTTSFKRHFGCSPTEYAERLRQ